MMQKSEGEGTAIIRRSSEEVLYVRVCIHCNVTLHVLHIYIHETGWGKGGGVGRLKGLVRKGYLARENYLVDTVGCILFINILS